MNLFSKFFFAEAATHNQIEYVEIDDVKYGFVPSANKRYGMMRFKAGAKKASEKSAGIIVCIHTQHSQFLTFFSQFQI